MKFTKISSALIALICAGAMFGSVSASAEELVPMEGNPMSLTSYDPCDVNHDGVVDIMDSTAVSRYLSGKLYVPDYNRLDADRNMIVDDADVWYIMQKIILYTPVNKYLNNPNASYVNNTQ